MMTRSSKPKLLLIGHTYAISANRAKAHYLCRYFEVVVATMDLEGWVVFGRNQTDSSGEPSGNSLVRLRRWPRWCDHTKIFFRGLTKVIASEQPDVILVENEPWSLLRWQSRFASWLVSPRSSFAEFSWENVKRKGLKGFLLSWIYRAAAATTDKVICGNRAAAKIFMKHGLPRESVHVDAQLGVSEEEYPLATTEEKSRWKESHGWREDDVVIGFCGRFVEEKGVMELAHAIKDLRSHIPDLRLALLGQGPLHQNLMECDLSKEWLCILPPVANHEVGLFLNKIDIFVLPSKPLNQSSGVWEEQFGHALIEAITAGAVTIGSDCGAIPEVLDNPHMIFQSGSVDSLKAILLPLINDRSVLKRIAGEQRRLCLAKWHHKSISERYAAFLSKA